MCRLLEAITQNQPEAMQDDNYSIDEEAPELQPEIVSEAEAPMMGDQQEMASSEQFEHQQGLLLLT